MRNFSKKESKSFKGSSIKSSTKKTSTHINVMKSKNSFHKIQSMKSSNRLINKVKSYFMVLEINNSKSIVDSTWGAISNFFKMSQTSKYTTIAEQIKK